MPMAPKRPSPSDDPPSVSSSDQEPQQVQSQDQEAESEAPEQEQEQEESSDDDDQQPNQPPIENNKITSSPSAEGSDSGPESESEPPAQPLVDLHVKPISSKPNRPDPSITALPAPKRAKKDDDDAAAAATSDSGVKRGKHLFKRLWTEEDEIVIMKGIIDYCASKNKTFDPPNDVSACFECIKHNLESQGTRKQLMNKIGKLKFKYLNNAAKGRVFTNAHEQLTYDLSAQIWGGSSSGSGASNSVVRPVDVPMSNGKAKAMPTIKKCENVPLPTQNVKEEVVVSTQGPSNGSSSRKENLIESDLFRMSLRFIELDKNFMRRGIDLINSTKKLELEERWRKLHVVEMELFLRRTELIREQTKLMLDAYKKP